MTRELCIMACVFCRDPMFQRWAQSQWIIHIGVLPQMTGERIAKMLILYFCAVESRSELDTNPEAAKRFHDEIRTPYLEWREHQ